MEEVKNLKEMSDLDKCRYIVGVYFKNGFNAQMVCNKLNELLPDCYYTPIEVYDWLKQIYGQPNSLRGFVE